MNGTLEAANKNIKKILREMVDNYKKRHENLPFSFLGYRTIVRTSTGVEVDEDPAEAKKEGQDATTEKKKKTKKIVEKYWDWELTNETQPIWLQNPKEVGLL
ncbi:PREDICTED: heat shock protein 90-6, mitochondrial-like [Nicotiana attenuata]|uniref:heat shock protein 90-6, mitochondrial-like n=1 Tax=Nicotiana attenuata TaxID=49451 RepID=UPI000904D76B|nr:PREDICTED: heat shock protein 90-6, mitochondrial-like [Nicotiana attenuata]